MGWWRTYLTSGLTSFIPCARKSASLSSKKPSGRAPFICFPSEPAFIEDFLLKSLAFGITSDCAMLPLRESVTISFPGRLQIRLIRHVGKCANARPNRHERMMVVEISRYFHRIITANQRKNFRVEAISKDGVHLLNDRDIEAKFMSFYQQLFTRSKIVVPQLY